MRYFIEKRYGWLIVFALMVAYSAYFSVLSIQRHNTFRTHASDLGQMDQALWNTLHGNLLEDTRPNGQQLPRLTDHVEPIFLAVSLAYLLYDGVEAILVLQSIALALAALPLFWIAKRRLKNDWAALAFAAMYLLFPALEAANLAEFHAVTLAPAPLMFAYNYAQERAWKRYALFSLIALAVKEEIALLVFVMAVWAAFTSQESRNTQHATRIPYSVLRIPYSVLRIPYSVLRVPFRASVIPLIVAALSLVWFFTTVFIIIPQFSPAGRSVYLERYPGVSRDIGKTFAAIPQIVAGIFIPDKIAYVLQLLASVGFIALLDPIALLLGAPSLILNLLSNYPAQYSGTYHYSAPVAPYFVLAAIGGAAAVIRNSKFVIRNFQSRALAAVVVPAFLIALGYHAIAGYTPIGGEFFWPDTTPHQELFARFAKQIPSGAKVSTTSSLFPHLSHRRVLYRFPVVKDAEYILLDVSQAAATNPVDYRVNYLDALKQGFGIRDALDGYILLQRGLPQKELPDGFYNFLRACTCVQPQQRVAIDFDDKIRLLGYDVRQDDWQRVYLRTYWTRLPGFDNNNYALFPFYPDENGTPRADAQLPPLLVHFWYPTSRWQEGEVVIADTVPIELGARAKIGVGVFFGASWDSAEFYLAPRTSAPISGDGKWVLIGEIVQRGKKYEVVK